MYVLGANVTIEFRFETILMSESMKMIGKAKNGCDKRKKGAQIWPETRNLLKEFA